MNPSPAQIEGFFHGLDYAQSIAQRTVRGQTGARAIAQEAATLKLLKEKVDAQTYAKANVRFSEEFGDQRLWDYLQSGKGAFREDGDRFEYAHMDHVIGWDKAIKYTLIALTFVAALLGTIHFSVV